MKLLKNYKINGTITENNSEYTVNESNELKTLSVAGITIQPGKKSFSHSHPKNDELYYIHSGSGTMNIGGDTFEISAGNIIFCDGKKEHYISNTGNEQLYLTMIYNMQSKNS